MGNLEQESRLALQVSVVKRTQASSRRVRAISQRDSLCRLRAWNFLLPIEASLDSWRARKPRRTATPEVASENLGHYHASARLGPFPDHQKELNGRLRAEARQRIESSLPSEPSRVC
jgi:hypothetical protein